MGSGRLELTLKGGPQLGLKTLAVNEGCGSGKDWKKSITTDPTSSHEILPHFTLRDKLPAQPRLIASRGTSQAVQPRGSRLSPCPAPLRLLRCGRVGLRSAVIAGTTAPDHRRRVQG